MQQRGTPTAPVQEDPFRVEMVWNGTKLYGKMARYQGGQLGVQFYVTETDEARELYAGSPYGRPSCNIPEKPIRSDQMWVRTYDEHTGALDAMIAAGIVRATSFFTVSGEFLCDVLVPAPPVEPNNRASLKKE